MSNYYIRGGIQMPFNYNKLMITSEDINLRISASSFQTKKEMDIAAPALAQQFGRTEMLICKRIEAIKGRFWAEK